MSGFLARLAERALGVEAAARPVVPAFFAEWRTDAPGGVPGGFAGPGGDGLELHAADEGARVAPTAEPGRVPASLMHPADGPPIVDLSSTLEPARPRPAPVSRTVKPTVETDDATRSSPASRAEPAPMRSRTERPRPRVTAPEVRSRAVGEPPGTVPVLPATPIGERAAPTRRDRTISSARVERGDIRAQLTPEPPPIAARMTVLASASAPSTTIERVAASRRAAPGDATPGPRPARRSEPVGGGEDRVVEISIGRIEVRAATGENVQPRSIPAARPGLSLEAYLQRRTREARA